MVVSKGLMESLTLEIAPVAAQKAVVIPRESGGGIQYAETSEI